jgi:hypothetical protein
MTRLKCVRSLTEFPPRTWLRANGALFFLPTVPMCLGAAVPITTHSQTWNFLLRRHVDATGLRHPFRGIAVQPSSVGSGQIHSPYCVGDAEGDPGAGLGEVYDVEDAHRSHRATCTKAGNAGSNDRTLIVDCFMLGHLC